jgi:hypothetical protein
VSDVPNSFSARWPASRQLWTLAGAVGLVTLTLAAANGFLSDDRRLGLDAFGQDFMAFYSAGKLALAGRGGDLYVGRELGAMAASLGGRIRHDDVADVTPSTGDVATIFGLNLAVWRDDPWVTAHHDRATLDVLADALAARRGMADKRRITWRMRQTVVERI